VSRSVDQRRGGAFFWGEKFFFFFFGGGDFFFPWVNEELFPPEYFPGCTSGIEGDLAKIRKTPQ